MSSIENNKPHHAYMADTDLSDTWKMRFQFIEENGYPRVLFQTKKWNAALKKMSIRDRMKVNASILTYAFGFIYLLILGLWKKAILMIAAFLVVGIIAGLFINGNLILLVPFYFMFRTNAWYYDLRVKGKQDWSL